MREDELDLSMTIFNDDNQSGTSTLERTDTDTKEDPELSDNSNADRFAHYVSRDRMERSRQTGKPVIALCGKVWIPTRGPEGYPVCPDCKKIYQSMNMNF